MIGDDECRLWQLARTEPGALEVYIDWLLENHPKRGKLLQKSQSEHTLDDTLAYQQAWRDALGLARSVEIDADPLPTNLILDDSGVAALAPVLDRLPFLHVTLQCSASQMFQQPVFAKVRSLTIWAFSEEMDPDENYQSLLRTYHGEPVVDALCASPRVADLEELWLLGQQVGARCAAMIAGATFRNLRALSISNEPIGDEGAAALAASPVVSTLRRLSFNNCKIGDAGARALSRSPHLANLEELGLWNETISHEAIAALRSLPRLRVIQPQRG